MLETVREFGARRLEESGAGGAAHDALVAWAVGLATRLRREVFGARQIEVVDLLDTEEANLADVLRQRLLAGDAPHAVPLLAALGALWSVTGNFPGSWRWPTSRSGCSWTGCRRPSSIEVTVDAVALVLVHLGFLRPEGVEELTTVMRSLPEPTEPWSRVARAMFLEAENPADRRAAVLTLTDDPDRRTVAMAWQWAAILAENEGAIDESAEYLERALALIDEDTTAWEVATLNTQAAMQALNDRRSRAGRQRTRARRSRCSTGCMPSRTRSPCRPAWRSRRCGDGRLEDADRLLDEIGDLSSQDMTAGLVTAQVRAELSLVRGDVAGRAGGVRPLARGHPSVGLRRAVHQRARALDPDRAGDRPARTRPVRREPRAACANRGPGCPDR